MAQFEELMEASSRVSAASRPLPIYYALAQAGRAIVAAHSLNPSPTTHGLVPDDPAQDLMTTQLRASKKPGWYQAVSDTVGSPTLHQVELGELWAAIPDLVRTPLPDNRWPKAVQAVHIADSVFAYVPSSSAPVALLFDPMPGDVSEAQRVLTSYPGPGRLTVSGIQGSPQVVVQPTPNGPGLRVGFSLDPEEQQRSQVEIVSRRAPEYRFYGDRWLIPAVSGGVVLTPIMAWWALLFSLSMLARYHPDAWVSALDVNRSKLAVPLEDALDQAMTAIPHLVLEALLQQPVLLRQ